MPEPLIDYAAILEMVNASSDPAVLARVRSALNVIEQQTAFKEVTEKMQRLEGHLSQLTEKMQGFNEQLEKLDALTVRALELWIKKMEQAT